MATPQEKLAAALDALRALQEQGVAAIRANTLKASDRAALLKGGFLQPVLRGWYIPARPADIEEESTTWYAAFWPFCAAYLRARFGERWCLSPEQSLSLHAGNKSVPRQLLVRAPGGSNKITSLPHNTSLFDMRAVMPVPADVEEIDGLRVFSLPAALVATAPRIFQSEPLDTRAVLASIGNASEILARLLESGHSTIAGRLAGAFRNIGRDAIADDILATMRAAGYAVREQDPFANAPELALPPRALPPFASRLRLMWQAMRAPVIANFPTAPGLLSTNAAAYLKHVQDVYITDAYNSLSIEGYRVRIPAMADSGSGDGGHCRSVATQVG